MPKKKPHKTSNSKRHKSTHATKALSHVTWLRGWFHKTALRRVTAWLLAVLFVLTLLMYIIGQWYIYSNRNQPIELGATFIPGYARFYGLDPQETLEATIDDLGFERLRFVSYWSDHEAVRGTYDFSDLDWQFAMAEEKGVDITLTLGLRQPRWPECHKPDWAVELPKDEWYPALKDFMQATIERYKHSPALVDYQLENEFLLEVFGECPDHDRERLIDEFNFVKSLDPTRSVVISRSNNATPSWPIGEPRADVIGAAVYKRVWDRTVTKRYFEYPLPAWYYSFLAGGAKLTTGRDSILHELQAEPWLPDGYDMRTATTEELYQTMDAPRLRDRFQYGRDTGIKTIDLWGVEWWYFRKISQDDSTLWDVAREEIAKTKADNKL
ncbi:hypothetical protein BH23PAT2_BH23PAT2_00520 [soil metagenome]